MIKKIFILICCLWPVAHLCAQTDQPMRNQVELAFPYKVLTYSGISTKLKVNSTVYDPAIRIKSYQWDMYSDGKTILSTAANSCEYRYSLPGTYRTTVTALLSNGYGSSTSFNVEVTSGAGVQSLIAENKTYTFSLSAPSPVNSSSLKSSGAKPKDSIVNKFALLVSGCPIDAKPNSVYDIQSNNVGVWNSRLKSIYAYDPANIYYLDANKGKSADVDDVPSVEAFGRSFEAIRDRIDEDDILFIWIADHGHGYKDPKYFDKTGIGHNDRNATGEFSTRIIPNGSDIQESDIKLKATHIKNPITAATYRFPGLNKWTLVMVDSTKNNPAFMYRIKYIDFDKDKFIEVIVNYLTVDTDNDGKITVKQYSDAKSKLTLDDDNVIVGDNASLWGKDLPVLIDNYHYNEKYSGFDPYFKIKGNGTDARKTTVMFDKEGDNKLDMALVENFTSISALPSNLAVAGTDTDNDGLIDGIDINGDGDKTDWYDFDESIDLLDGGNFPLYSSEFNEMLNTLRCKNIIIGLHACFSGGFIHRISAPGRVVMTVTQDRYWGWSDDGSYFTGGISRESGINTTRLNADVNKDGIVSMLELYNYAYSEDKADDGTVIDGYSMPRYNDSGDGIMYEGILSPTANAGCLGNILSLTGYQKTEPVISNKTVSTRTEYSGTSLTLSNVKITPSGTVNLHQMTGVPGQISLSSLVVEQGGRLVIDNAFCK